MFVHSDISAAEYAG